MLGEAAQPLADYCQLLPASTGTVATSCKDWQRSNDALCHLQAVRKILAELWDILQCSMQKLSVLQHKSCFWEASTMRSDASLHS